MISTYGIRKWLFSDLLFILNNNIIIFESKYIEIANFIEYGKKRWSNWTWIMFALKKIYGWKDAESSLSFLLMSKNIMLNIKKWDKFTANERWSIVLILNVLRWLNADIRPNDEGLRIKFRYFILHGPETL